MATPGRFSDYVECGIMSVKQTFCFVLDEADRMMEFGFEATIRDLVQHRGMPSNSNRQTMMFSATFPDIIRRTAEEYLRSHLFVRVGRVGSAAATVSQVGALLSGLGPPSPDAGVIRPLLPSRLPSKSRSLAS